MGTCADASGNQMNGMKKGDKTTLMSQRACAAACDADAGCIGYQHGKGECIAFGATAGAGWTSVTGTATAITTSDTTATEYICVLPCGTGHTTLTATFDACTLGARYHEVGTSGGCRGNGGGRWGGDGRRDQGAAGEGGAARAPPPQRAAQAASGAGAPGGAAALARPQLGHISAISRPYLGHISAISRPYLGHISAISRRASSCARSPLSSFSNRSLRAFS